MSIIPITNYKRKLALDFFPIRLKTNAIECMNINLYEFKPLG